MSNKRVSSNINQQGSSMNKTLEQDVYQLKVLGQIKQAVLVDQSPRNFAETAFAYLEKIIPYDHASVILFDFHKDVGAALAVMGSAKTGIQPGDTFALEDCFSSIDRLRAPVSLEAELLRPQTSCLMENCLRTAGIHSYMSHLLISHNAIIGTLNIASHREEPYDETAIRIARDVADSLAVAIQKAMLFNQTRLKALELESLSKLSFELRLAESWNEIIAIICKETERAICADISAVIWRDGKNYRVTSGGTGDEEIIEREPPNSPELTIWKLLDQDQPIFVSNPIPTVEKILSNLPELPAALLLPLKTGDRLVGKLFLGFLSPRDFTAEDERLLTSIADIAGNALYRAKVMETLEDLVSNRTRQLETLYNISKTINQTSDLSLTLERSLAYLQQATGTSAVIHLMDDVSKTLVLKAAHNLPVVCFAEVQRIAASVTNSGSLKQVKLCCTECDHGPYLGQDVHYIGLPLIGKQQDLGVLSLLSTSNNAWGEDDLPLLSGVADHISIAIENAQLRNRSEAAIVIEERQSLARELHDSISQLLYSQLLFAQAGQRAYETGELELIPLYLNRLGEVAEQAFKEMRLMIYSLRPQLLESVGLTGALQHRLATVEKRTGLDTHLNVSQDLKLPAAIEDALFRIAQEALNNTLKHASATSVDVSLHTGDGWVSLTVADNGKGFDRERVVEGVGLSSLQERACQLGGSLTILSQPLNGTTILANIPYRNN